MPTIKQKIITVIVLIGLFVGGVTASRAAIFGDDPSNPITPKTGIDALYGELQGSGIAEEQNITEVILKYINFFLPYLALLAFAGFVYAGFLYVGNFGVEEQLTKAKTILIWSIVGLLLVIASYTIVNLFTKELVQSINQ